MKKARKVTIALTICLTLFALVVVPRGYYAQQSFDVKANYTKSEHMIAMRDGVKLFTAVYSPKDTSQKYPILLNQWSVLGA